MRFLAFMILAVATALTAQSPATLSLEKEIPLPGVQGRIDHLSVDAEQQRLFVSALGNGTVEVVDLRSGRVLHQIPGLKEPQGVLFDPDSHRLFVASDGDGTLRAFDATTFAPLGTANLGDDADNLRYDARAKEILVGYGSGGLAAFDAGLHKAWNIALPSHPESFQLEQHGSRIFVNLPKSLEIAVIDRDRKSVVNTWHRATDLANFPMALDEADARLFVGFRRPARLQIIDTRSGNTIASLPTVDDTDDLFYDAATRRIYVIGGEGFVDVFQQQSPDRYTRIGHITTAAGARTGLFLPTLHRLVVAAPRRGSQSARLLLYRTS
jgi:DNA-binding beta-propeller fold protein YncE